MEIRYVCSTEGRKTNVVLSAVAEMAAQEGIRLAGTIEPAYPDRAPGKCHIIVALLPDGERRNISLQFGSGATGCRLDAGALEEATMVVHDRLPAAQALIVNKFGKQEAAGRGLVAAIVEACERGLPVLVGISPQWREAFLYFADGKALEITPDQAQIFNWLRRSSRQIIA